MNIEKAVKKVKYLLFLYKDDYKNKYKLTGELFDNDFEAIETVLNELEYKQAELEKKDKIIDEAKKYCEKIMNYEEYEKKHSKLSREIVRIKEGLTTHYKMWRVANNINNILQRK